MPQSLGDLERQRSAILHGLTDLGDFRPGSITTTSGRCGKANCRCHRPNEPPHGPTDRLTYKVEGKTVSESLPNPAAFAKAEREVAEFRNYQRLSQQFVEVNTRICALRPVAETAPSAQEKNRRRDPAGSRPRSRSTAAHHFPRPQGNRPIRSGECRGRDPFRDASGRGRGADATAAIRTAGYRTSDRALCVRSHGSLQGNAGQVLSFGGRHCRGPASLLPVFTLLQRTASCRWRTGYCRAGVFTRCKAHGGDAGRRDAVRAGPRTDAGLAGLEVPAKPSNGRLRALARKSPGGTSRKSTAPNNSSCPSFPNRPFRKCMC